MSTGDIPETDCFNRRLRRRVTKMAGKFKAAFALLKSDGKARRDAHNFKRNFGATFCCDLCLATQPYKKAPKSLLYSDCNDDAAWLFTMISQSIYEESELLLSPWLMVPGWSLLSNLFDFMHVCWLGFGRDVAACVIVDLYARRQIPGNTETEAYAMLTAKFQSWCKARNMTKVPFSFTPSSLGADSDKNEYPELASYFKAVHVHAIVSFLADTLGERTNVNFHDKCRGTMVWSLQHVARTLDGSTWRLDDAEKDSVLRAGKLFLTCYQSLAAEADREKMKLWKHRPKLHYFWHIMFDNVRWGLNPVTFDCASDESYLGKLKAICRNCHGASLSRSVLLRWRLGLATQFRDVT